MLKTALPAMQTLCVEHPGELARSPHGNAVLLETILASGRAAAAEGDDEGDAGALPVLCSHDAASKSATGCQARLSMEADGAVGGGRPTACL